MYLQHFKKATPAEIAAGENWYPTARKVCQTLSARYDRPIESVAAILAITSQRVTWKYNLTCTVRALKGLPVDHLGKVRAKVQRIMDGEDPADVVSGRKVRAFWRAILGDRGSVVLDTWMLQAAGIDKNPSDIQYNLIADHLRAEAHAVGLAARDFQAIVWCVVRGKAA